MYYLSLLSKYCGAQMHRSESFFILATELL